jgi:fluoroquinolone transport system permease protein
LAGGLFKFGLPVLVSKLGAGDLVEPYYIFLDLLLVLMTPYMFCFASSMVVLGEMDRHVVAYLYVTPLGKRGYLITRLLIPSVMGSLIAVVVLMMFSHNTFGLAKLMSLIVMSALLGILLSMMVVRLASNRAEGIAIAKFSGLLLMGIFVPDFIDSSVQSIFYILPTYWIGKFGISGTLNYCLVGLLILFAWLYIIYQQFEKKIG